MAEGEVQSTDSFRTADPIDGDPGRLEAVSQVAGHAAAVVRDHDPAPRHQAEPMTGQGSLHHFDQPPERRALVSVHCRWLPRCSRGLERGFRAVPTRRDPALWRSGLPAAGQGPPAVTMRSTIAPRVRA